MLLNSESQIQVVVDLSTHKEYVSALKLATAALAVGALQERFSSDGPTQPKVPTTFGPSPCMPKPLITLSMALQEPSNS